MLGVVLVAYFFYKMDDKLKDVLTTKAECK